MLYQLSYEATDVGNSLLQMGFFIQTLKPAVPLGILEFIVIDVDI